MDATAAAEYLSGRGLACTARTVLRWARQGHLRRLRTPGPKGRGRVAFTEAALETFLAGLEGLDAPQGQPGTRKRPAARPRPAKASGTRREDLAALRRLP